MRRFLVVGCGGSGGATLAYLMDQLRSELAQFGIQRLPRGWRFVHIDVPTSSDEGPDGLGSVLKQGGIYVGCGPVSGTYNELDQAVSQALGAQSALGDIASWAPRDPKAVHKPISVGAGQARAVGRMIVLNKVRELAATLRRELIEIGTNDARSDMFEVQARVPGTGEYSHTDLPVVLVVSSMAGGAGASTALDVCRLLTMIGDGIDPHLMGVFMFAPNIFDSLSEASRGGVRPNALAMLGEIVAAQTSAARAHDVGLLGALGQNRGAGVSVPFARVFPVGRYIGADRMQFGDGQPGAVYRGLGRGLAGLMLSGPATDQFVDYDLGNNLSPTADRSVFGWGVDADRLPWGSYGYAALSMGRDRYAEYAAQRLGRSCVDRLLRGHLQRGVNSSSQEQVDSLLGSQWSTACVRGLNLPDLDVAAEHLDTAVGGWLSSVALPWSETEAIVTGVAQQHLEPYIPNPAGIPAEQWTASLGQLATQRTTITAEVDREVGKWAFHWQVGLQSRVDALVTDAVARLGLPYACALVDRLVQHCRDGIAPAAKRLTAYAPADVTAVPAEAVPRLASMRGPIVNSRHVFDDLAMAYRRQLTTLVYAQAATLVERLLLSLSTDVLQPLRQTLADTQRTLEVAEKARPTDLGLAHLATDDVAAWPSEADAAVPSRFTEAGNEVLLTSSAVFDETYTDHVRRSLGNERPGEYADMLTTIVGMVLTGLWPTTGGEPAPGRPLRRAAEWRSRVFPIDPYTQDPLTPAQARYELFLRPADIRGLAQRFIRRPKESFETFCRLSIRDFLLADGEPDGERRQRADLFAGRFVETLTLARPLVGVHPPTLRLMHNQDVLYRYKFSAVPVNELPVRDRLERALIDPPQIDDVSSLSSLRRALGEDTAVRRIDVFGSYPNYSPLVFDAVLGPAAEQWARPSAESRKEFWQWRRARPLAAALPLGDAERGAMVAGWLVGQIVGALRIPPAPYTEPVRIWFGEESRWLDFPHPLLTPPSEFLAEYDWLPAVLESVLLAVACSQQDPVTSSLLPYRALRSLYDASEFEQVGGLHTLAARTHLLDWLRGRPGPGGGRSRVPGADAAADPAERADAAIAWLAAIRDLAGTHYLPPGDRAPGGGSFSVITKRRQASATPLFRDVAADVHQAAGALVTLVERLREEAGRPLSVPAADTRVTAPEADRFEVPQGGTF